MKEKISLIKDKDIQKRESSATEQDSKHKERIIFEPNKNFPVLEEDPKPIEPLPKYGRRKAW